MGDTEPIFGKAGSSPEQKPLYYDKTDSPTTRKLQITFVTLVVLSLVITFVLTIYRAIDGKDGLYILLFISLLSFAQIELFVLWWIRRGDLEKEKFWWLYVIGFFVILESIFTDILMFHA
ncbi:uncharacterized protein [Oscarella lobularis]|uniref:uncharacterized protein n=1 Tax=Oscarella lobularis TaxID=121494 RepID=UPI0033143A62